MGGREDWIVEAIRHGAEAGKLRQYVRQHGGCDPVTGAPLRHGETGLGGLIRLADRHGGLASAALNRAVAQQICCGAGLRDQASAATSAR
jgi:hypothetical protein